MADNDGKLESAFQIGKIFDKIGVIGWKNLIVWYFSYFDNLFLFIWNKRQNINSYFLPNRSCNCWKSLTILDCSYIFFHVHT